MRRGGGPLLAAIAGLLACAAPSRVVFSRRAADADTSPRRVFILSRLSETGRPGFGPVFAKAFEGRFDAALRRCGLQTGGYSANGQEAADDLDRAASEYRPDAIVILRMSHGTVDQFGALLNGMIEITLFGGTIEPDGTKPQRQRPKALWKGAATFAYGGLGFTAMAAKAEAFADDLSNKLKEDGFLPGCARVEPRDLPAVASPVDAARYVPSSEVASHGGLTIGAASYLPAENAEARIADARAVVPTAAVNVVPSRILPRLGPTRDQLAGEGRTRFSPGVAEYLRGALGAELRKMGIDTTHPQRALRAEIEDATLQPSTWGYRVSLRVKYDLTEAGSGRVLYSSVKTASPAQAALLEAEALNQAIRASAEALVRDPGFAAAIR